MRRAKIKNIEATEEAKLKLLWERQNKKDGPSSFVPSNMAVNFVQHNRCEYYILESLRFRISLPILDLLTADFFKCIKCLNLCRLI